MSAPLPRPLVNAVLSRALRSALVGRERVEGRAERGRFTDEDARRLLARSWQIQSQLVTGLAVEPTFGARMNVWLASLSLAFHRALVEDGVPSARATDVVADTAWLVYRTWGKLPWLLARIATRNPLRRLRICTDLFRRFPFNAPGYLMEDVEADDAVIFSVRKCPVAEFFAGQGATDLCVRTWCALDFPLAETWGGSLQRSGTLAGGATGCDFKWSPRSSPAPSRLHARTGAGGEL